LLRYESVDSVNKQNAEYLLPQNPRTEELAPENTTRPLLLTAFPIRQRALNSKTRYIRSIAAIALGCIDVRIPREATHHMRYGLGFAALRVRTASTKRVVEVDIEVGV
jgi:hypothetical protein